MSIFSRVLGVNKKTYNIICPHDIDVNRKTSIKRYFYIILRHHFLDNNVIMVQVFNGARF